MRWKFLLCIGILGLGLDAGLLHWFSQETQTETLHEIPAISATQVTAEIPPKLGKPFLVKGTKLHSLSSEEKQAVDAIHRLFSTGNYNAALETLRSAEQALKATGGGQWKGWIAKQAPALYAAAGWTELKLGRCDTAETIFLQGKEYQELPEIMKGLAYCASKNKDLGSAESFLEDLVKERGIDPDVYIMYADVLESSGRLDQAVSVLEDGLTTIAQNGEVAEGDDLGRQLLEARVKVLRARARVGHGQGTEKNQMFQITYSLGKHEDILSEVFEILDKAVEDAVQDLGFRPPVPLVEVILYDSEVFHEAIENGPEWVQGVYDGRIRVPVQPGRMGRTDQLARVLRHEVMHALLSQQSGGRTLPSWLDEGLAQRFECWPKRCESTSTSVKPGKFLTKIALEQPYVRLPRNQALVSYRQSLFMILNLEALRDGQGLSQLVNHISAPSPITSDGILEPLGYTYEYLHNISRDFWQRGVFPRLD